MRYINIQIQVTEHLQQTPISQEDIEEILGLLGFSPVAIATSAIQVSCNSAVVRWFTQPAV